MPLEENLKHWVQLDNNIKDLNISIKKLRLEKDTYNNSILEHISENNLENVIVKIGNGTLKFVDVKHHQPLTYKFISETLSEYFEEDDEAVMEIICYLKSKRQHKLVKEIKRYDVSG